jgi:hypothetical protein
LESRLLSAGNIKDLGRDVEKSVGKFLFSIHLPQVLIGVKVVLRGVFNTSESKKWLIILGFLDLREEVLRC